MKKLLSTLFVTAVSAIAFAQTINFGIKAGLNLSQLSHSDGAGYNSSLLAGFNAGGILDIGFKSFSIQPGIFFSTKGEKDNAEFVVLAGSSEQNAASKTILNYIEVPVNFLYKSKIAPGIVMHLGGGPYIAYGLSQTLVINGGNEIPTDDAEHKFNYKNPDFGINFIAGVEIKNKFIIDAGYGLGLANIVSDGSTTDNRVISVSVGYLFR